MRISVKAARINSGLTQKDVAERLGVAVSTYGAWEADPGRMTVRTVRELAGVLGVPVDGIELGFVSIDNRFPKEQGDE